MTPDIEAENRVYQAQLRIVVDRIERWIPYYRQRNRLDVQGYPESTQIERMAGEREAATRLGVKGDGVTGKRVYACMIPSTSPGQDWEEEMGTDEAIRALPGSLRRAIKTNYLEAGTQEMKAERLKLSRAVYRGRLDMAYHCLVGWGGAHRWFAGVDYFRC